MFENFKGIDADSSPIPYRACFNLTDPGGPRRRLRGRSGRREPLVAPRWFDLL